MGNGPGFDAMYDRLDKEANDRTMRRIKRRDMLFEMMRSVGFGDSDGSYGEDLLAKEAVRHLKMAYAILTAITPP